MLAEIFFLKLEAVLRAVQEKADNTRFVPKAPSRSENAAADLTTVPLDHSQSDSKDEAAPLC
jgi:hypothetical protein